MMANLHFRVCRIDAPDMFIVAKFCPVDTYSKHSIPVLLVDAHFTVVEAALKGYMKWRSVHGSKLQQDVTSHCRVYWILC